ncbi:hypothetical protein SLS62_009856 [Diatrype stigma]|uniref:Uncharacterized protein n=1 Tax=Diatrype stigma TaxID=117547 RepID=A0AAN9UEK3_9PEZI
MATPNTPQISPVRKRLAHVTPPGYVNFSDAIAAANEDLPTTENPSPDPRPTRRASRRLSIVEGVIQLTLKLFDVSVAVFRYMRFPIRRNPDKMRHIISRPFTSMSLQEANADDSQAVRLGLFCFITDVTLALTYNDFCGFCGSPMKNKWSTPAIIEGVVVSAAPPGWEDNMKGRHRALLIVTEITYFVALIMCIFFAVSEYVVRAATFDSWLSSSGVGLAFYWLNFWQPRLGLLTIWGFFGRLLSIWIIVWIAVSSAMTWSLALVLILLAERISIPQ